MNTNDRISYVYRHRRLDTNEVFYIGKSSSKKLNYRRAYDKQPYQRNKFWSSIIAKTSYTVEIISINLSKEEACELEEFLIALYGRRDLNKGTLVNLTDGGEGIINPPQYASQALIDSNRVKKSKAVMHFNTGQVFFSLKAGCEEFDYSYSQQKYSIKNKNHKAQFYFIDSPFVRPKFEEYVSTYKIRSYIKGKTTISFNTGQEYKSLKTACNKEGYNYGQQMWAINNKAHTARFYYKDEIFERRKERDRVLENPFRKIAVCLKTGKEYPSLAEACRQNNINYKSELRRISRKLPSASFYYKKL